MEKYLHMKIGISENIECKAWEPSPAPFPTPPELGEPEALLPQLQPRTLPPPRQLPPWGCGISPGTAGASICPPPQLRAAEALFRTRVAKRSGVPSR